MFIVSLSLVQEDVRAAVVSSDDEDPGAEAAARSGGVASTSGRSAKHPRLSREQKQVRFNLAQRKTCRRGLDTDVGITGALFSVFRHRPQACHGQSADTSLLGVLLPQMKQLIEFVQPFDQLAFKSHGRISLSGAQRRGLDTIDRCGRQLLQELQLNGCASGLDINVQVRLKASSLTTLEPTFLGHLCSTDM